MGSLNREVYDQVIIIIYEQSLSGRLTLADDLWACPRAALYISERSASSESQHPPPQEWISKPSCYGSRSFGFNGPHIGCGG